MADDRCGMKLGTDGVLLGAWAGIRPRSAVLDIGSGCGILALTAAQRGAGSVTCVEIDSDAAAQCAENAALSPWRERIKTVCGDFLEICGELPRFDHLISNPPFYASGLKAPGRERSLARQGRGLDCRSIISRARGLLNAGGRLSLICPPAQTAELRFAAARAGLHLARLTELCSLMGKEPIRHLWEFSLGRTDSELRTLAIGECDGSYTREYSALTRDFYLNID